MNFLFSCTCLLIDELEILDSHTWENNNNPRLLAIVNDFST